MSRFTLPAGRSFTRRLVAFEEVVVGEGFETLGFDAVVSVPVGLDLASMPLRFLLPLVGTPRCVGERRPYISEIAIHEVIEIAPLEGILFEREVLVRPQVGEGRTLRLISRFLRRRKLARRVAVHTAVQ